MSYFKGNKSQSYKIAAFQIISVGILIKLMRILFSSFWSGCFKSNIVTKIYSLAFFPPGILMFNSHYF